MVKNRRRSCQPCPYGQRMYNKKLTLPPIAEVRDIVLDITKTIAPTADQLTIRQSVAQAEILVALFSCAIANPILEAVLKSMLCGMLSSADSSD